MSRFLIAFLAIAFVFAFAPLSMAQFAIGPGGVFGQPGQGSSGTQKATNLNSSRSNIYRTADPKKGSAARATTVKSSKSNTSDLVGQSGGGGGSAARATTVKSSKSNTSDLVGQSGGGGSAARATTVKSSKSNTSDRATTVKSSKSNTSD